ncbi:MAG: linear amide C-N hydrolase [Solirubrobacterales bacterium]
MQKSLTIRKGALWIIAGLAILTLVTVFVFRAELMSLHSLQKVDRYGFYTMEYTSDYGFDEFLEVGASSDKELIQFIVRKILKGLPIHVDEAKLTCTTFNAVTPKGDYVFGRNFDLYYSPGLLVHTKPANGYESLSIVNLAFLGYKGDYMPDQLFNRIQALAAPYAPMDGMNEKGLSVAILLLPDKPTNQQTKRPDITSTTAIRLLLDKAATVDEAVALLKQYDMHDSAGACYHYQIADAGGKSVIVEYVNNEMHLIKPKVSYQACTNFYQTPGAKYYFGMGQNRYAIAMTGLTAKNGVLTEQDAMHLLKEARLVNSFVKKTGITYRTQWSAVYNNTRKSMDLCVGQNYGKVYQYSVTGQ